jgi:hypothetical protein
MTAGENDHAREASEAVQTSLGYSVEVYLKAMIRMTPNPGA